VYHEFAFAPQSSIFHQVYSKMESFPHPMVRLGLDAEWPSGGTVQTYDIETSCMSRSEDILITGGSREGCAVYSVWDTRSADSETFVHPCQRDQCRVNHVSIDEREEIAELLTRCRCSILCRWNISSDPHCLLERTQLGSLESYWLADDGSKVVSRMENGSIQLSIRNNPVVRHILWDEMRPDGWQFSPGPGDKVLGERRRYDDWGFAVWECASGRKLFRKSYTRYITTRFSPDGTTVACAGSSMVELISAEDGTVLRSWDGIGLVKSIQFFPKGDKFVIQTWDSFHLFDRDIRREIKGYRHPICISPDGQRVAIMGEDYIDIFNHALDERLEHHKLNGYLSNRTYFSWNHSVLLSINYDDSISFHHLSHNAPTSSSTVEDLCLSPDSRHLLTFHVDNSLHVWDVKSARRLHTFDNNFTGFSDIIGVQYAPNSSSVLVWDDHRLMALQFSAGLITWALSVPQASSALIAVAFFPNSDHLLVIHSDGNVTTVSLNDTSTRSMSPLYSQVQEIRHMVISPNEQLVAICGDVGLIIHGIGQDMYRIPLFSEHVKGAGFSPDGTNLYILEANDGRWMLSRVDTQTWTVYRIWADYGDDLHPIVPIFTETMIGDYSSVVRNSWEQEDGRIDGFIDLSTGKHVIPPASRIEYGNLFYQNEWIMRLPVAKHKEWSITQDHLAYIDRGKAFVVDYSSPVTQV
jgi:WD40 repeat protein